MSSFSLSFSCGPLLADPFWISAQFRLKLVSKICQPWVLLIINKYTHNQNHKKEADLGKYLFISLQH